MKLIIAGSRTIHPDIAYAECVKFRISNKLGKEVTEIVSGGAKGVDLAGEEYAKFYDIAVSRFTPNWEKYGKSAGPIRNRRMAEYADALLLIWDGKSRGSLSMKSEMEKLKKPIYEIIIEGNHV